MCDVRTQQRTGSGQANSRGNTGEQRKEYQDRGLIVQSERAVRRVKDAADRLPLIPLHISPQHVSSLTVYTAHRRGRKRFYVGVSP